MRDERGVAPIISSLLMIVIVMAGFSLAIGMTQQFISRQRSGPSLALRERFAVEDAWFLNNATGRYVCAYITNTGDIGIKITSMKINDVGPSLVRPQYLSLAPAQGGWMNASYVWTAGTTYKITLETERGKIMNVYEVA